MKNILKYDKCQKTCQNGLSFSSEERNKNKKKIWMKSNPYEIVTKKKQQKNKSIEVLRKKDYIRIVSEPELKAKPDQENLRNTRQRQKRLN